MLLFLALLAVSAIATPVPKAQPLGFDKMGQLSTELSKRQFNYDHTRNELAECKPITVIFARGTVSIFSLLKI